MNQGLKQILDCGDVTRARLITVIDLVSGRAIGQCDAG